ncbi:MAG: hypothetical protein M3552_22845, partial [Planctomycetota bacterium]|nr:hypothetical protein [Planctomycetota bacterium]
MDGRLRANFGYAYPSYPGGGTTPMRTWGASKAPDGILNAQYNETLVVKDPVTNEVISTRKLSFNWTKPAATPQPETFTATYEYDTPKKYIKSVFNVGNGTSTGNVVLEYADEKMGSPPLLRTGIEGPQAVVVSVCCCAGVGRE